MSRIQWVCLAAGLSLLAQGCATKAPSERKRGLTLARGGASEFAIVVADDASPSTRYAAEELQRFLEEITSVKLPIHSDAEPLMAHEIVIGQNAHLDALGTSIDFGALGDEGYVIRTVGPHLVIAGGDLRGNLYGVYGLLEDHLGCRWFTPEVSRIPKRKRLTLPPLDDVQVPVLEYREPFVIDCFDGDWCARNRVNSSSGRLEEKHGGKVRFGAGMFVHTFNTLIPPDQYFDEHPEYFSEIDGKRIKDRTQLCCTNEDVVRLCTERMIERIKADPGAFVYSLSQNDWHNQCQCARCQALAEAEESQMAPVLQLVNRVAEAVEREYPDKAIETLAYQWTRKAPKTMRPRPNVIVRLCSIECCFMHPLATCDSPQNAAFREDAKAWAKVADRLWVWDYVTSFRHFLCPFPNLRVLDDNIRFFIDHNVVGIFEQDNYKSVNGELSPLGGYIIAKYLWNPHYDEDTAINEFLKGVYGKAAKPIRRYIDLLHDRVEAENLHTNIWIGPVEARYLDDAILAKSDRLWDKAEAAVAGDSDTLERVQTARLCVEYAQIERNRNSAFVHTAAGANAYIVKPDPAFVDRVKRFFEVAHRANVTWIDEWRVTLDTYEAGFQDLFEAKEQTVPMQQPVEVAERTPGLSYAYYEGSWKKLPDFATLTPVETGEVDTITLDPRKRDENYALRFTGYLRIRQTGVYRFYTHSDDGSRLYIGGTCVVDNDGVHEPRTQAGTAALTKGLHPITIEYFNNRGPGELSVTIQRHGRAQTPISPGTLSRVQP
ncbi:MAG: DUF4838 domain-containing protein [Nitrospiraceae bacterium]|nr:DUF4838 domain-containing protein [Nitrospiraceae bacterium]